MERLTRRINGVVVYVGAKNPYSTGQIPCEVEPAGVREMMARLAAYEDTRLEPEEVLPKDKADEIALKLMRLADLESTCSYARLRELAEADKDGRLVVLPCEVGTATYYIHYPIAVYPDESEPEIKRGIFTLCDLDRVGHSVFLTREEAEKALEAMKDE